MLALLRDAVENAGERRAAPGTTRSTFQQCMAYLAMLQDAGDAGDTEEGYYRVPS
jgi:hypothetical protein